MEKVDILITIQEYLKRVLLRPQETRRWGMLLDTRK